VDTKNYKKLNNFVIKEMCLLNPWTFLAKTKGLRKHSLNEIALSYCSGTRDVPLTDRKRLR